jgi:hypothetical protein
MTRHIVRFLCAIGLTLSVSYDPSAAIIRLPGLLAEIDAESRDLDCDGEGLDDAVCLPALLLDSDGREDLDTFAVVPDQILPRQRAIDYEALSELIDSQSESSCGGGGATGNPGTSYADTFAERIAESLAGPGANESGAGDGRRAPGSSHSSPEFLAPRPRSCRSDLAGPLSLYGRTCAGDTFPRARCCRMARSLRQMALRCEGMRGPGARESLSEKLQKGVWKFCG